MFDLSHSYLIRWLTYLTTSYCDNRKFVFLNQDVSKKITNKYWFKRKRKTHYQSKMCRNIRASKGQHLYLHQIYIHILIWNITNMCIKKVVLCTKVPTYTWFMKESHHLVYYMQSYFIFIHKRWFPKLELITFTNICIRMIK